LRAFHADLTDLCAAADAETIYWVEDGANPHKTTLRSVPLFLEGFGAALRDLFGAGLFISPALLAGGNAARDGRWFLRAAGLQESEGRSAVPVRTLALAADSAPVAPFFAMTPFAPAPNAGEQMEAYARFLLEITGPFAAQGVLVFCPSQTAVRALHHALTGALRAAHEATPNSEMPSVRAQWIDGNRDAIVRLYGSGRGGFVIASEGIPGLRDLDGEAPALWLLTRMPLPPPRDPLLEARGEPLREEGRNVRAELWQPAAVLRLKREWAMLHREGAIAPRAIWLLDARAATEGLGAKLGEALGAHVSVARSPEELGEKTRGSLDGQ
jgi:Rad3-related DNA helicase